MSKKEEKQAYESARKGTFGLFAFLLVVISLPQITAIILKVKEMFQW